MAIVLPKTPVGPTRKSPKVLVLYGTPKCGKTTALSKLENNFILDIEDGAGFVEAHKPDPENRIKNINDYTAWCNAIIQGGRPYKYVSLDTATELEQWCEQLATEDYKNSTMGKNFQGSSVLTLSDGAGYRWLRDAFQRQLHKLYTTSSRVIIVCHLKEKFIASGDRTEDTKVTDKQKAVKIDTAVNAIDIDLTGKLRQITCANADAIGYMYRMGDTLKISFAHGGGVACGARPEHLRGQTFEWPFWDKIYID